MRLFVVVSIIIISTSLFGQEAQGRIVVNSEVSAATVFRQQAEVVRKAELRLSSGEHILAISNLTTDLLDESVRVEGFGSARFKIMDVSVVRIDTVQRDLKDFRRVEAEIERLNEQKRVLSDQIAVLHAQKQFIESIQAKSSRDANASLSRGQIDTAELTAALNFYSDNLNEVYGDIREASRSQQKIEKQLNTATKKKRILQQSTSSDYKEIRVVVHVESPGNVGLKSSYLVTDASWYSLYDARISTNIDQMDLSCYAMVEQGTGENWNDIKLTLSTANPGIQHQVPQLEPLFLEVDSEDDYLYTRGGRAGARLYHLDQMRPYYVWDGRNGKGKGAIEGRLLDGQTGEALVGANVEISGTTFGAATDVDGYFKIKRVPAGDYKLELTYIGFQGARVDLTVKENHVVGFTMGLESTAIEGEAVVVALNNSIVLERELEQTYSLAHIEQGLMDTEFQVPTLATIPGNGNGHKVVVAIEEMPVALSHVAVPRENSNVYIEGKVLNATQFPWLPGDLSVFVDGRFVNKTVLPETSEQDTLSMALGIDRSLKAQRRLVGRKVANKGVINSKTKVTYSLVLTVRNASDIQRMVKILDQIPLSWNDDIKIELVESGSAEAMLDDMHMLELNLELASGEEQAIPIVYSVQFPKGSQIAGLE